MSSLALRALDYLEHPETALADAEEGADRREGLARDDWHIPSDAGMVAADDEERASSQLDDRRQSDQVVLLRIGDQRLERPMLVHVEDTTDGVVISNDDINVWGIGANRYAALGDFRQTFLSVYESYSSANPSELTDDAHDYLDRLARYVGRV